MRGKGGSAHVLCADGDRHALTGTPVATYAVGRQKAASVGSERRRAPASSSCSTYCCSCSSLGVPTPIHASRLGPASTGKAAGRASATWISA